MRLKLKELLELWREAHVINYIQCECIHKHDLSQEHFRIVSTFDFEGEQKWFAIHKSMIHGDWKTEHDSYEAAYSSLSNHIREQAEEEVFLFMHNHEHCESKGFMFTAGQLASMNRIYNQLIAL